MNRREFLTLGACAAAVKCLGDAVPEVDLTGLSVDDFRQAVATLEATKMTDVAGRAKALETVQKFIYAMKTGEVYEKFLAAGAKLPEEQVARAHEKHPVLWWYDHAFDKVLEEFKATEVKGDKPTVWYVYNMGVIVKTKTCAFSIDLCHRKATAFAPYLDFALVTHNHGDHFTMEYLSAMSKIKARIVSNFILSRDNYVAEERTLEFCGVKIHVTRANHNKHLPLAVNCYEIEFGGEKPFVLYHSGDACRSDQLKPKNPVDVFIGHCAVGLNFKTAFTTTMPAKLMLTTHHQELGHLGGRWRCIGFHEEPAKYRKQFEEMNAGDRIAMPVWGDRIV